jgi:hypothetical protein
LVSRRSGSGLVADPGGSRTAKEFFQESVDLAAEVFARRGIRIAIRNLRVDLEDFFECIGVA